MWTGERGPKDILESMVAITFTRKAALEMKERIRKKVEKSLDTEYLFFILGKLSEFYPVFQNQAYSSWAEKILSQKEAILQSLGFARVTTIHSFALSQLRAYPVESHTDPGLRPQDEDSRDGFSLTVREALLSTLNEGMRQSDIHLSVLIACLGFQDFQSKLEDFFKIMREKGWEKLQPSMSEGSIQQWKNISEFSDYFRKEIQPGVKKILDLTKAHLDKKEYAAIRKLNSELQLILSGDILGIFEINLNPKIEEIKSNEELDGLRSTIRSEIQNLNGFIHRILKPSWNNLLALLWREYTGLQSLKKELSFQEIEWRMIRAMRKQENFYSRVLSRLEYLFLDEYQDTSSVQKEIFDYFLDGAETNRVIPFVVGDPKQSIYGFRGSEVKVFSETAAFFKQHYGADSVKYLQYNYRSHPNLVRSFNMVFKEIFSLGDIEYQSQKSGRENSESLAGMYYTISTGEKVDEIFQDISRQAAALIGTLIQSGRYRPGDIMILMRKKSRSNILTQVLRKNLPEIGLVHSDTQNLLDREEIKYLIDYLRALDDPWDDFRMLALLKSPFFRMTDSQLLQIAGTQGGNERFFRWIRQADTPESRIFLQLLSERRYWDIAGLTEEIIQRTGWFAYLNRMEDRRETGSNVVLFLNYLRTLQDQEMFHLTDFLYYLELYGLELTPAQTAGENADAVRIMTVHGAKGLQSKVVIYLATGSKDQSGWLEESDGRIGMKILGPDRFYSAFQAERKNRESEEEKRLFYVACTRSEEEFYYLGWGENTQKDGWSEFLRSFTQAGSSLYCIHPATFPSVSGTLDLTPGTIKKSQAWYAEKLKTLMPAPSTVPAVPVILTVTQLLDSEFDPAAFGNKYIIRSYPVGESLEKMSELEDAFTEKSDDRAEMGDLLHRVLELSDEYNYSRILSEQLSWSSIPMQEKYTMMENLLKGYYTSSFYQDVIHSLQSQEKEWPFLFPLGTEAKHGYLKGVIDCYAHDARNRGIILDYKLHIGQSQLQRYTRQLQYYGLVLRAQGYPVDSAWLFEMESSRWLEVNLGESDISGQLELQVRTIHDFFKGSDR